MFVIYKYVNDPLLKIKSEKYTGIPEFVQAKDLFPVKNLLQTSPLNVQLTQLSMLPAEQQLQLMQQNMRMQMKSQKEANKQNASNTVSDKSQPFIPESMRRKSESGQELLDDPSSS